MVIRATRVRVGVVWGGVGGGVTPLLDSTLCELGLIVGAWGD